MIYQMYTKTNMLAAGLATMMLSGCLIVPPPRDGSVILAPPLPAVVWLETEPYYVNGGYTYYYQNNNWYYARQRNGPWVALPRDRFPKEVRYRDHGQNREREHTQDHDRR